MCCAGAFGQQYVISTIAGNNSLGPGYSGDGGPATAAQLNFPAGIAVDKSGNLYIADGLNNRVRKVSGGVISTVAGNGTEGYSGDNAAATSAELDDPTGVAVDGSGNLYIADAGNEVIREVSPSGTITTFAGSNSLGAGYSGDGAAANAAQLSNPVAVAVDSSGNVYIADSGNDVIREVSGGNIMTIPSGILNDPDDVSVDSMGNVYVADTGGRRIVVLSGGNATVFAGNGNSGFSGDGGLATNAEFNDPVGVDVDPSGYVYISDTFNNRIRKVSADGVVMTIAGQGGAGYAGDGGPATAALLYFPHDVAVDSSGNVYIADEANNVIRMLQATPPVLSSKGVVNAASFGPQTSPGALASIFGINLTSGVASATVTPLATTLGGVNVTVNGLNAPILFVSPTQVNFQVPWETNVGSAVITSIGEWRRKQFRHRAGGYRGSRAVLVWLWQCRRSEHGFQSKYAGQSRQGGHRDHGLPDRLRPCQPDCGRRRCRPVQSAFVCDLGLQRYDRLDLRASHVRRIGAGFHRPGSNEHHRSHGTACGQLPAHRHDCRSAEQCGDHQHHALKRRRRFRPCLKRKHPGD